MYNRHYPGANLIRVALARAEFTRLGSLDMSQNQMLNDLRSIKSRPRAPRVAIICLDVCSCETGLPCHDFCQRLLEGSQEDNMDIIEGQKNIPG